VKYNIILQCLMELPDGTPQKLLDVSRLNMLGWRYKTELEDGIEKTYKWFLVNVSS